MTALKTLIFTVIVPGTVAVYLPRWLGSSAAALGNVPMGGFRYSGLGLIVNRGIDLLRVRV